MKRHFLFLCLFSVSLSLFGQSIKEVEADIQRSMQGKIVRLKKFNKSNHLHFEKDGGLNGKEDIGPWTLYGLLKVDKVKINEKRIKVSADRVYVSFKNGDKKEFYNLSSDGVDIDIEVLPGADNASFSKALSNVFITQNDDFAAYLPNIWRSVYPQVVKRESNGLMSHMENVQSNNVALGNEIINEKPEFKIENKTQNDNPVESKNKEPRQFQLNNSNLGSEINKSSYSIDGNTKALQLGSHVSPPRQKHAPEPQYPSLARELKHQGTVVLNLIVTASGSVIDIRIIKPLGLGLDEAACETVSKWEFEPGKKDGKPVSVFVNVEVSFNLY